MVSAACIMIRKREVLRMKILKCGHCGKIFMVDPDDQPLALRAMAAGAAFGAAAGSILPYIGTALGAMMGAKCAYSAKKGCFDCPRCGRANDINCCRSL